MIRSAVSPVMPLLRHPLAQLHFDLLHPLLGALEAHRAPQLLGLAAGEPGGHHRHPQQLLLEERHAERAREHRLERRMQRHHRLPPGAAIQIRMHHLPDDRPGADDRHLARPGRRSASASAAAASPSARATPPGRRRSCRPSAAGRRRRDRRAADVREIERAARRLRRCRASGGSRCPLTCSPARSRPAAPPSCRGRADRP